METGRRKEGVVGGKRWKERWGEKETKIGKKVKGHGEKEEQSVGFSPPPTLSV